MKLTLILLLSLVSKICLSQTIILDEDFNDNKNKWRIETNEFKEKKEIIRGRYELTNPTTDRYSASVITLGFDGKADFVIETVITKLPRENDYQKINTEIAKQLLPQMNYTNKSNKTVLAGLTLIENQQASGIRYNLNLQGKYEWYYSKTNLNESQKLELSAAMGFIENFKSQILYSDEAYGVIWGGHDDKGYFLFCIAPFTKSFFVANIINGNITNIIETTTSSAILQGNTTNKLSVGKLDDKLIFFINDTEVGSAPNQGFHGTNVGFFSGPETHISIDNIKVLADIPDKTSSATKQEINTNKGFTSSGSGFLISPKGYFVTNYHVIEGANEVWVETNLHGKKETLQAKVELVDNNNDLAILKLDNLSNLPIPCFGFGTKTIDVGTSVFAMGYPLLSVLGDELKITDGIISSKTGYKGNISLYQISAPIQPGNSGGALFDKSGTLVGITNAGIPDAQNVGYAIKTSYLKNLVELLPEEIDLKFSNSISDLSFTEQIKELSKFIVIIKTK